MQQDPPTADQQVNSKLIRYGDREIDFTRYVGISDYTIRTMVNSRDRALHWVRWGFAGGTIVRVPEVDGAWVEQQAEEVYELGMRGFSSPSFHSLSGSFIFVSDQNNDETFNVYRYRPEQRELTRLTNVGYTMAYAFPLTSNRLIFLGRPEKLGSVTGLFELDIKAPEDVSTLHLDDESFRIYPYLPPVIDEANERIAFVVKHDNRRSQKNLAVYSRSTGQTEIVTDPAVGRNFLLPLAWSDNQLLLFTDDGTNQQSLYRFEPGVDKLSVVMANPMQTVDGVFDPITKRVLAEFRDGSKGELLTVDVSTGKAIARQDSGKYHFSWSMCHPLGQGEFAVSTKLRGHRDVLVCRLDAAAKAGAEILSAGFVPSINKELAAPCRMKEVTYPTFDVGDDGKVRQIEAILFMPAKVSADPANRAAIVWAHGGPSGRTTKSWHANIQLLAAFGYIVLGPNPRGSTGQGKKFEDLNNNDWGGGDYLDYEYGLRYLIEEFQIPHERIGIAGFSYGGYMSNWAATRPNGLFGFAISLAGISDLAISIEESVVATNTISEMGDFDENAKPYYERSPINWAEHMDIPLLLIHGAQDRRTSTNQSRVFYQTLKKLNKDVELVEIEGEGHGFRALRSQHVSFQRQASFLRRVAPID